MRIYVLGICGTFMGGLARLATELGHRVAGCDAGMYPPMSEQLAQLGIELFEGYDPARLESWRPDVVVVGNALSRGNPCVEALLDGGLPYVSGPQWLYDNVLRQRQVIAVAGTHGKTTTASLICWLLDYADLEPGFLIGGVPENFGTSARLGGSRFFVVEADEYDTAFFDKRSKFVHYRPDTLVLNNLEYDHADIFTDLGEIKKQFHHLVRTVPGRGLILLNKDDANLADVIGMGCWTALERFSITDDADWTARATAKDFSVFQILENGDVKSVVDSPLIGSFNMANTLAAVAAVHHAGVPVELASRAVSRFASVKRRLQRVGTVEEISVYDDFAHHPTAIEQTLTALRQRFGDRRIVCVLEPRSNTMLSGGHRESLGRSLAIADCALVLRPQNARWDVSSLRNGSTEVFDSVSDILRTLVAKARPGDQIVIMSNGSFDNIHRKLVDALGTTGR